MYFVCKVCGGEFDDSSDEGGHLCHDCCMKEDDDEEG
jgi:hypothetical protein